MSGGNCAPLFGKRRPLIENYVSAIDRNAEAAPQRRLFGA